MSAAAWAPRQRPSRRSPSCCAVKPCAARRPQTPPAQPASPSSAALPPSSPWPTPPPTPHRPQARALPPRSLLPLTLAHPHQDQARAHAVHEPQRRGRPQHVQHLEQHLQRRHQAEQGHLREPRLRPCQTCPASRLSSSPLTPCPHHSGPKSWRGETIHSPAPARLRLCRGGALPAAQPRARQSPWRSSCPPPSLVRPPTRCWRPQIL